MRVALRSARGVLALVFIAVGAVVGANVTQAQEPPPGTGASADKDCPGEAATLGQTITCNFTVENIGDFPAQVTTLTEQTPFPSGPSSAISCTAGGAAISQGSTLAQATPCTGTFQVTIPNDPALCGTVLTDRVDIQLLYTNFQEPLVAGAFATHLTLVQCPEQTTTTTTPSTTTTPPATTTPTSPRPPTTVRPTPPGPGLPPTGRTSGVTVAAAAGMIAFGLMALLLSRRRTS